MRLKHESLDVTLAYLKGKDAESEEAQEHANSISLALYAWAQTITAGDFWLASRDLLFSSLGRWFPSCSSTVRCVSGNTWRPLSPNSLFCICEHSFLELKTRHHGLALGVRGR